MTEWESGQNAILKSVVSGYESCLNPLLEVGVGRKSTLGDGERLEGKDGK